MDDYQQRFRKWLGEHPHLAAADLARATGYSTTYILWVAGLIGKRPWPGSCRFKRRIRRWGFDCPIVDLSPSVLGNMIVSREVVGGPK